MNNNDDKGLEISEEILQILLDKTAQTEAAIKAKIEAILNRDKPKCNKCGNAISSEHPDTIQVKISWGYESTGKDGDYDIWNLCENCAKQFKVACPTNLICNFCNRSIIDVTATLNAHNPHCIYYGDFPAAVESIKTAISKEQYCGLEYAEIADRIVCEECYESFIEKFVIPIESVNQFYLGEEAKYQNRIEVALKHRNVSKDSMSTHYSEWLPWVELLEVKGNYKNRHEKITHLSYADDSLDLIANVKEKVPDWEPTIYAQTGDNQMYYLPVSWLQNLAEQANQQFDPTKLKVTHYGELLHFGEFQLATKVVIAKPEFKNRKD